MAGHDGHPGGVDPLCHLHGRRDLVDELGPLPFIARRQVGLGPVDRVRDEHPHPHAQATHLGSDPSLLRLGTPRHVVVLQGPEPLISHELELA